MPKLGVVALLLALVPALAEAQVPLGPEFQVNAFTTSIQTTPVVARTANGSFVVAWTSFGQDGRFNGVFARRYDPSGTALGSEFQVNSFTTSNQTYPAVASDASGNFVVVWQSFEQDGSYDGVFAQRYDASGMALGAELQINSYTTSRQGYPAVALDAAGNFIVVWVGSGQGDALGVFGRRYSSSGVAIGDEFRVNSYTTSFQTDPAVASDANGNFVVVWVSLQDGGGWDVFGQRYDGFGTTQGPEFRVNTFTTSAQFLPAVASDTSGNFVVAWHSLYPDGSGNGVFGQRYDAFGTTQGPEFRVNAFTTNEQTSAAVAWDASGNFVVVWQSLDQETSGYGVVGRRFNASGAPQGGEFLVNSYTTGDQRGAAVAVNTGGNFVVAWTGSDQDGDSLGVFAQRFAPDVIFSDGFESGTLASWSGSSTDGGDLSLSNDAALNSTTIGLQGVVDDVAALYVQNDAPADENRYRARFHFDPNGFDPGEVQLHQRTRTFIVFSENPSRRVAAVVLRRVGGAFSLMGRARQDDNSQADTGFFPISDAPHVVEIDLRRASDPDAMDGTFQLWIDGTSVATLGGLDNSLSAADFVRLGALSVKPGASGTMYWDEFESRRQSYIGP